MRINIGCGEFRLRGFINIDLYRDRLRQPDVLADGRSLPFRTGSIQEIYAGHILEHFTPDDANRFLVECRRVLVPDGILWIVVPDVLKATTMAERGEMDRELLRLCVFGDPAKGPGYSHLSVWTGVLVARSMLAAGFREAEILPPSRSTCPHLLAEAGWQAVVRGVC